jgi:hypothetical protein
MSSPCSEILSSALNVLPSSRRTPPRVSRIRRSPVALIAPATSVPAIVASRPAVSAFYVPCGIFL